MSYLFNKIAKTLLGSKIFYYLSKEHKGKFIPVQFIQYCLVGCTGLMVYYSVLAILFKLLHLEYKIAIAVAIEASILMNFNLNNLWTFKHLKLNKSLFLKGLGKFHISVLLGASLNYIIANIFYNHDYHWILSSFLGAASGAFFNFYFNKTFTWKSL